MRKQEEEQLEAIKELSIKKDEFISVASHELKTPLTSAKAYLQLAAKTASKDGNEKFISGALKQLDRLQKLTSDLLDVSKINAGRLDYKMSEFDFNEVLEEAIASYQSTISSHTIELIEKVHVKIEGDYQRLEQVINNMISNAVKYSPKADKVLVRSSLINDQLVVSVQDFGIGIPQDRINRLFERFYRIEETAMHFQGMGLGLFIVAEILGRHKGRFWLESEQGKGSTFYFMLPLKDGSAKEATVVDEVDFYSNRFISIKADGEQKWLYVDWKGFQNSESVQRGCMKMLELLKQHSFSKVLNDNTNVLGTWSDAAEWVGKDWFPMMEAAGLTHFAWVYSPSRFSQLSADKSVNVLKAGVTTRLFNNLNAAAEWLKSV
nr:HAMP domain-containing sensor histidine kinase [Pedobacter sp. SYSU D00535]